MRGITGDDSGTTRKWFVPAKWTDASLRFISCSRNFRAFFFSFLKLKVSVPVHVFFRTHDGVSKSQNNPKIRQNVTRKQYPPQTLTRRAADNAGGGSLTGATLGGL